MPSTKIIPNSVAEIEAKLKAYFGDMVKIEFLENCLKQLLPNDAKRFCHLKLAELYANRLMWSSAAENMELAAETAVTFKDKISFYMKEISYLIKISDFLMIDKAFKKALLCANTNTEKETIKQTLKLQLTEQAEDYEKKNKRSNAIQLYQRLLEMPITSETEKRHLIEKLAGLNSKLGRIKEAIHYETLAKKPLEPKKNLDEDGKEVKKLSFEDLGIEWA